jgi:hypothetical protein
MHVLFACCTSNSSSHYSVLSKMTLGHSCTVVNWMVEAHGYSGLVAKAGDR